MLYKNLYLLIIFILKIVFKNYLNYLTIKLSLFIKKCVIALKLLCTLLILERLLFSVSVLCILYEMRETRFHRT